MLYEKLKKSKFDPHDAMKYLYPLSVKKMAEYLGCDYPYLSQILGGGAKAGIRLEADIWRLADEIKNSMKS